MFNIFGKKKQEPVIIGAGTSGLVPRSVLTQIKEYPAEVIMIHNEFNTAADNLLAEANKILIEAASKNISKVNRLEACGFKQSSEVSEIKPLMKKVEVSNEQIKMLEFYRQTYPFYKFITENQVTEICNKYNLVCGKTSDYKGFVPEKNLADIEKFLQIKFNENYLICRYTAGPESGETFYLDNACIKRSGGRLDYHHIYLIGSKEDEYAFQSDGGKPYDFYATDTYNLFGLKHKGHIRFDVEQGSGALKICAPISKMNMTNKRVNSNGFVTEIPDPVVLKPVKHGYLIVTAWGDEASDPLVINEINN